MGSQLASGLQDPPGMGTKESLMNPSKAGAEGGWLLWGFQGQS